MYAFDEFLREIESAVRTIVSVCVKSKVQSYSDC